MLICHCRAVNEATVRSTILGGASDLGAIASRCGAGAECGGCGPALLDLLAETRRDAGCRAGTSAA